jgi:hypothetical protein
VDKSIIEVTRTEGRSRYRMLESVRQYGLEQLHRRGLLGELRQRHCDHYRQVATRAAAEWLGPRECHWLLRLRRELPNIRVALDFCAARPDRARHGLEIAVALTRCRFWFFDSALGEGRSWIERFLGVRPHLGATVFAAWLGLFLGESEPAATAIATARGQAAEQTDDEAAVFFLRGAHALLVECDPHSIDLFARARELFRQAAANGDAHMTTMLWAIASAFYGEAGAAETAGREYLAEAEAHKSPWARSWALWGSGLSTLRHGNPARAAALLRESLVVQRSMEDRWGPVWGLEALAWALAETGPHEEAARTLGAASTLRRRAGVALTGLKPLSDAHDATAAHLERHLGPTAYAAAFRRGETATDPLGLVLGPYPGNPAP